MSESNSAALLIFAKYPEVGRVKTRLTPPLEPVESTQLYRAFLSDIVEEMIELDHLCDLRLLVTGIDNPLSLRTLFHEDNLLSADELFYDRQRGTSLGEILFNGFHDAFEAGYQNVCAIGTDHPTLSRTYVVDAFTELAQNDVVLGPAEDGGYYLIGMGKMFEALFEGMPWSTPSLYSATVKAIASGHLNYKELPQWYDVDDLPSLQRLVCGDELKGKDSRTSQVVERLRIHERVCGS